MVIALAAYVHDALAAQEDAVGLHAGLHGAGAKVAEFLALGLAVVDGGFERWRANFKGTRCIGSQTMCNFIQSDK